MLIVAYFWSPLPSLGDSTAPPSSIQLADIPPSRWVRRHPSRSLRLGVVPLVPLPPSPSLTHSEPIFAPVAPFLAAILRIPCTLCATSCTPSCGEVVLVFCWVVLPSRRSCSLASFLLPRGIPAPSRRSCSLAAFLLVPVPCAAAARSCPSWRDLSRRDPSPSCRHPSPSRHNPSPSRRDPSCSPSPSSQSLSLVGC